MSEERRRYVVLANPSAARGRTRRRLPDVERELERRGLDYRVIVTAGLEHACDEAERAFEAGEIPVSMGGDGLIGAIAGRLAGRGATVGLIPGGRGNDFARVLGIPDDARGAAGILAEGVPRAVDIGEVNGRRFVCIASAGFDSNANRIANEARLIRGNLVYAYAGIRALLGWRPARFTVTADGERREFSGYTVAAANSKAYGGGMYMAPDADLEDGLFDLVLVADVPRRRFFGSLPKVFKGEHVHNDEVTVLRAAEAVFEADRPFAVYADGEHLTDLPARLRVLPGALQVIAPA